MDPLKVAEDERRVWTPRPGKNLGRRYTDAKAASASAADRIAKAVAELIKACQMSVKEQA